MRDRWGMRKKKKGRNVLAMHIMTEFSSLNIEHINMVKGTIKGIFISWDIALINVVSGIGF